MKANLVVGLTLLCILVVMNHAIWQKERHLAEGLEVILELAPVDPRSLMQGDYMALEFAVGREIRRALLNLGEGQSHSHDGNDLTASEGFVLVEKNEKGVHQFVAIYDGQPLTDNRTRLQFKTRNNKVKFATDAYFFSEGQEPLFSRARYGLFRVNEKGEMLLVSLLDEQLKVIEEGIKTASLSQN